MDALCSQQQISIQKILTAAQGRTILLGEHHTDRTALQKILSMLIEAHYAGYETMGVEISNEGILPYWGLADELAMLNQMPCGKDLDEYDEHSDIDADTTGARPRPNRHWQLRAALALGWNIFPIDPFHWNTLQETEDGYIHSREPAIAGAIRNHGPMIAVCGYGHMAGLHNLLGQECVYAMCSQAKIEDAGNQTFWIERLKFAASLPLLTL